MTGISVTSSAPVAEVAEALVGFDSVPYPDARARLEHHADVWRDRPLIREIYAGYHAMIRSALSAVPGANIEVGAGHGSFSSSHRNILSCDLVPCPWLDCAADALDLPFREGSLSNIVMVDVLHHLVTPGRFFEQACRALAPGGRIVLLEPYTSPFSWIAWRFFHDEDIVLTADPLCDDPSAALRPGDDPWEANIAIPTLVFWRDLAKFRVRFPQLHIVRRDRLDMLVYPLSGGFEQQRMIPMKLVPLFNWVERRLSLLSPLLAFRCFVVLQKKS